MQEQSHTDHQVLDQYDPAFLNYLSSHFDFSSLVSKADFNNIIILKHLVSHTAASTCESMWAATSVGC